MTPETFAELHGYRCVAPNGVDPNSQLVPQRDGNEHKLNRHYDARGSLVELFRTTWGVFESELGPNVISQAYLSETMPNVTKGWHLHFEQTDRFICVRGRVLVVTFDVESDQFTEHVLDQDRPLRVDIPPRTPHGWINIGTNPSVILNLCSHVYTGKDEWRRAANAGPNKQAEYDWRQTRDG